MAVDETGGGRRSAALRWSPPPPDRARTPPSEPVRRVRIDLSVAVASWGGRPTSDRQEVDGTDKPRQQVVGSGQTV